MPIAGRHEPSRQRYSYPFLSTVLSYPGVHTHPSWTVSISGPDPNNPQQTTTVGSATFTHPGPYTNANVSVTLPAPAGAYSRILASLTGGEGTATSDSDSATILLKSVLCFRVKEPSSMMGIMIPIQNPMWYRLRQPDR